jgi:hypothetical protein
VQRIELLLFASRRYLQAAQRNAIMRLHCILCDSHITSNNAAPNAAAAACIHVTRPSPQAQHQRRAYWQLQEKLIRYDNRANRCYSEFALASMLLGMLLLMKGGPDNLQMQLETVNQGTLSGLVLMMWVFWECYFSSIAAVVQVVQLGSAWVSKLQHKQKWEASDNE